MNAVHDDYIFAEPEQETRHVYMDTQGNPHLTREAAIAESVAFDLRSFIEMQIARGFPADTDQGAVRFVAANLVSLLRGRHGRRLQGMVRDLMEANL